MLLSYPIPLYPNSIYMIVLNVLQPHLAVQCDCSPSPSFPPPLLSFYPPPSLFAMDCLPIYSFLIFISLFIIIPPSPPPLLLFLPILVVLVLAISLLFTFNTHH